MKHKKPLISILVPVHNAKPHIAECIRSIKKQSFRKIEIIAIDDFSTDGSFTILNKLKKNEKRLRVYKNVKRYGIAVTMNRLLGKARGSYIAFASSEDLFTKNKLKRQLDFLNKNPEVVACGTQCLFINEKGSKIGRSLFPLQNGEITQNPLHGISMQFETVLINKSLLPRDVLKFDVNSHPFLYSDIFIKIAPYGKFANLKLALYLHRRNPKTYIMDVKRNVFSLIKLFIRSKALYDSNTPLYNFFSPLVKSV